MKNNFFSAVQGKFKAEFHGRYLGHILEQIAALRPEVIAPLLKKAPLVQRWPVKSVQDVTTEVSYLSDKSRREDEAEEKDSRRADLAIELDNGERIGKVLIEIKVKDSFLDGQLQEYIEWAKRREVEKEDRAVVCLTAYPIGRTERALISANKDYVCHVYLSDLIEGLRPMAHHSELISLFAEYLCQEGYAMFQIPPKSEKKEDIENADYEALLSFLVLTFLPHQSGKGKVSSAKKIVRGPAVFGSLVQNWQQVSDRLADIKLGAGRRPTIRYWPEQATSTDADTSEHSIDDQSILSLRKGTRSNKLWGRYWLTADTVLEDNVRIEWGQLLEVHRGERENDIDCSLYVLIQKGGTQFAGKLVPLKNGIRNQLLYNSGDFMEELISILQGVRNRALRDFPELKEQLDGL